MAQPWNSIVDQLRGPQTPPPGATQWTAEQLRTEAAKNALKGTPADPAFHGNGRYGAPPNPTTPPPAAVAAEGAAAAKAPAGASEGWFKRTVSSLRNPSAYGAGKAVGVAARVAGPALAGADVVSHMNDYKINDPDVDSSAKGTWNALRQGDFGGAGRSLSKGALEAGMDLGNFVANAADLVVPGKAPVSTAYNQMLRNQFGDQLVDNTGEKRPGAATAPAPAPTAATPTKDVDPRTLTSWGSRPGTAAAPDAPAANPNGTINKTVDKYGNVTYSGGNIKAGADINDPSGAALDKASGVDSGARAGYGVSTIDGIGVQGHLRQLANIRALGGGDSSGGGGGGGAAGIGYSRPSLRGGADSMPSIDDLVRKGLSVRQASGLLMQQRQLAQQGELGHANLENQAAIAAGNNAATIGSAGIHANALRDTTAMNNETQRYGHDVAYQGHLIPVAVEQARRARAASYMQAAGGGQAGADGKPLTQSEQYARAAVHATANGDEAAAKHFSELASAESTRAGSVAEQQRKGHEDLVDLFRADPRFNVADPNNAGKTIFDENGAKRAAAALFAEHGEKLSGLPSDVKKKVGAEIVATQQLQDQLRQPEMSVMDHAANLVGMYKRPADNNALPDLRGAVPRRRGMTLIPGNNTNDTQLDLPDGTRYNAGLLTKEQQKVLRERGVKAD